MFLVPLVRCETSLSQCVVPAQPNHAAPLSLRYTRGLSEGSLPGRRTSVGSYSLYLTDDEVSHAMSVSRMAGVR